MRQKTTLTLARRGMTLAGTLTRRTAAMLALATLTSVTAWAQQNYNVITEAATATAGQESNWSKTNENYDKLVDGKTNTKYGLSDANPWVEFHYAEPIMPKLRPCPSALSVLPC